MLSCLEDGGGVLTEALENKQKYLGNNLRQINNRYGAHTRLKGKDRTIRREIQFIC